MCVYMMCVGTFYMPYCVYYCVYVCKGIMCVVCYI
jgi:hypothetical protein